MVQANVVVDGAIDDDIKWSVLDESKIIDFLQDGKKETLFISVAADSALQVAFHLAEIDFDVGDAGDAALPLVLSYLVKTSDPDCLITPHNWHRLVYQRCLRPPQLALLFTRLVQHIQQLTVPYRNQWTGFYSTHFTPTYLTKLVSIVH